MKNFKMDHTLRLAVIGAGRWGPNLIRNFHLRDDCIVSAVCDQDQTRLEALRKHYQNEISVTDDWKEIVENPEVQAIVICTPTKTHYEIAKTALLKGKHVFVEKPLTTSYAESIELVEIAKKHQRKLMVGHVFLFNPAVQAIKGILDRNELGDIHYLYSTRTNLGPIRADVNALWDLAPHDISIILYLLGNTPIETHGFGGSYINRPTEDVAFSWMRFQKGIVASVHVSWLDPKKVRQLVVVGSRKMLVFDDLSDQPLRIFDKNVTSDMSQMLIQDTIHNFRKSIAEGNVAVPELPPSEPLKNECAAFVDWVLRDIPQPSDGLLGAEVVRVLETIATQMRPSARATDEWIRKQVAKRDAEPSL